MRRILLRCVLATVALPAIADDADLAAVQGTWQRMAKDGDGNTIRIVKTHRGHASTVIAYDAGNKILYSHTSEFELSRTGEVRVFTYFNLVVAEGENLGPAGSGRRSYIYKVAGDRFVEVNGLLIGQEDQEPSMFVWERMKE